MTQPGNSIPKKHVKFREGFRTITPYLAGREAAALIDFVVQAFDAEELGRSGPGSEGGFHAEVRIGDSILMIGGGEAYHGAPMRTSLHLYVPDAGAVYERAVAAGATSLYPPTEMEYGDREAGTSGLRSARGHQRLPNRDGNGLGQHSRCSQNNLGTGFFATFTG